MKLISTRDTARASSSYADVLLAGLAPDGGLYIPEDFPVFSRDELQALVGAPYIDIAFAVKRKLVDSEIPDDVLRKLIDEAYSSRNFEETPVVTPVTEIGEGLYLQNLSQGP